MTHTPFTRVRFNEVLGFRQFSDHPAAQLEAGLVQTSVPDGVEAFALRLWPTARRIEFCHGPQGAVWREGGERLAVGCLPQPGDQVSSLD